MYGYMTFHDKILNNLIDSVHNKSASHAYIFEGADGLFLNNCAKLFAAALTCENTSVAPCGSCRSCIQAKADTNPDICYIVREKENGKLKKTIGIEPIRNAVKDSLVKPFNAPKKVYIIEEGDLLTTEAQNAFLKTFEEPPEYAVFIIIVQNSSALLETILSRGVLVNFPPVADSIVGKYIEENNPDEKERLDFLIKYCEGIPGEADKIIGNENFEALREKSLEMLGIFLVAKPINAFDIQSFFTENKDDTDMIFDFWISFMRDIVIILCGIRDNIINSDKFTELQKLTSRTNEAKIIKAISEILKTKDMLERSVKHSSAIMHCALAVCD